MKFLNVIICYNNSKEVVKYIQSVLTLRAKDIFFSVVINAGICEDFDRLKDFSECSKYKNVNIFVPRNNLGYLNGLLYGYRQFVALHDTPDYVIFSNTDIEIRDANFFDKIEQKKYSSDIGCIGPSIYVREREVYDNPVCDNRRPLSEINKLVKILSIPFIRGLYVNLSDFKTRFTKKKKTNSRFVYEVHGCFFILSNTFASLLAQKEYGALMYSEEAYVAEKIREFGYKVYYDSDLEVIHLEHSVTKGLKGEKIAKHICDSMKIIRKEFYTDE